MVCHYAKRIGAVKNTNFSVKKSNSVGLNVQWDIYIVGIESTLETLTKSDM